MLSSRLMRDPIAREFLLAFWKIHILYHAADSRGVYGQWMLEELHHHGYRLSPGTLYPILARMARRGWLRASEPARTKAARVYRLTPRGDEVLTQLRNALDELYDEVGAHDAKRHAARAGSSQRRRRRARSSTRVHSR
jgi:DNA-binding PadR family transcriptional regulator